MATPGIKYDLLPADKEQAILFVESTGFYKNRLASYLHISRPTLDKILDEDCNFFTRLKAADAIFCKDLIIKAKKKDPVFILRTRYREEFGSYDESLRAKLFPQRD